MPLPDSVLPLPNIPQTCQGELKFLRYSYPKNVIRSYININSIRNQLNSLEILINKTVEVLAISESKLDSSFPNSQFALWVYKKPYRLDLSYNSGGLLVYPNNDIPSRTIPIIQLPSDIQAITIELNSFNLNIQATKTMSNLFLRTNVISLTWST